MGFQKTVIYTAIVILIIALIFLSYLAMTFGRNLVKETEGEVARQVKWPSGEALEQASGCA